MCTLNILGKFRCNCVTVYCLEHKESFRVGTLFYFVCVCVCFQMNKFFKPALSLLLELKLEDCSIQKRLCPLITFLARHRSALQKYIYPECFSTVMQYMWGYILQVHFRSSM